MFKIIQTLALVIMIVLFPPAALITVSQGAAPGDFMYPVKRTLEDGVLFLASLNPLTKAYFAAALANRRYDETALLLSQGNDASFSLQELVSQTTLAANDIDGVSSAYQRARLVADLSSSIQKYDQGLAKAQEQIAEDSNLPSNSIPIPQPVTKYSPQPKASVKTVETNPSPDSPAISSPAPTPTPTSTPQAPPIPKPIPSSGDDEARRKQEEIEKARKELEELRRRLEEEQKKLKQANTAAKQDIPVKSPSPSPSSKPSYSPSPSPSRRRSPLPSPSSRAIHSDSFGQSQDSQEAAVSEPSPSPSASI